MKLEDYHEFTRRLTLRLQHDSRVQGLVLLGSTASQRHQPDEWSDHDFFVITSEGVQEQFRTSFEWLPDNEQIVLTVRETTHGLKVLYRSGHILEYAVFSIAEISLAKANDYAVVFDNGGIKAAMQAIAVSIPQQVEGTDESLSRDTAMFLSLLVVGGGRVARGEVISGQVFIRTYALSHLLRLLTAILPTEDKSALDSLDILRRFEQVFPESGKAITKALNQSPLHAAQSLLEIYETHLSTFAYFLPDAVQTVREFLHRATHST